MKRTDTVKIFISHKQKDSSLAKKIKDELLLYGVNRLEFFLSEEQIAGSDWGTAMREALTSADILLLIIGDPSEDWGWCLYEAGFFMADENKSNRIIMMHNPNIDPPVPLQNVQGVPLVQDQLVSFLKCFFGEELIPGVAPVNPILARRSDILEEIASAISQTTSVRKTYWYKDNINIHLKKDQFSHLKKTKQIPNGAIVKLGRSSRIFGILSDQCDWEELKSSLRSFDSTPWENSIALKMIAAGDNRVPDPTSPVLYSDTGVVYRTILYRLDTTTDRSLDFRLFFVEETSPESRLPRTLHNLLLMQRATAVFLFDVVHTFMREAANLVAISNDNAISLFLNQFEVALRNFQNEMSVFQTYSAEDFANAFTGEDKRTIVELLNEWNNSMINIFKDIQQMHMPNFETSLKKLESLTQTLLLLASRRIHSLIVEITD